MKKWLVSLYLIPILYVPASAENAPAKPWKENAELSLVSSNGNAHSTTFAARNLFNYDWKRAGLELDGGALKSENETTTTAEQYYGSQKVDFKLTEKNYIFEKFRWDRNRFAGINHRYDFAAGYGRHLLDLPNDKLVAEIGGGYINEDRIGAVRNEFGSGRAYAKYIRTLSATAHFSQDVEYLGNFKDENDYRMNTESAVVASLSTHFSIKAAFVWKRVNKPPMGYIKDDTFTSVSLLVNY